MENKSNMSKIITAVIAVCLALGGYFVGKSTAEKEVQKERELLYTLNRSGIEQMILEGDGPIYVIGHRAPDTDTVCSAIVYARLLQQLGFDAKPAVTMKINNETSYILKLAGVEVPEILVDASGKNIFMVDHSEYLQAVDGIEDAHIVGVLDHHGVGTLTTPHQLVYETKPIGSTSTIIWLNYLNYGLEIDRETAYLMLGAILSDTKNLAGFPVTEADRQAVESLSKIAGVDDVNELYAQMKIELLSYEGMTDMEILYSDYKEYEGSGQKFGIGLVSAADEKSALDLVERMKAILPEAIETGDLDLLYVTVGVFTEDSQTEYVIPADEYSKQVFEDAFPDLGEFDGTAFVVHKGIGRKRVFVPGLTEYLAAHPHE